MQEADRAKKYYANTDSISKFDNKDRQKVTDKEPSTINYFLLGPNEDNDKKESVKIMQQLQRGYEDAFTGIDCFDGIFSFQEKTDSKPKQVPLRHLPYMLQKCFKEEWEWPQQQDITTPLDMNERLELCKSFVLVPISNGKVRLCLDQARLNQVLIRPVYRRWYFAETI